MVHARGGKRTEEGDEIICKEAQERYRRNSKRKESESATAREILERVNCERVGRGMKRTSAEAIRKRISKLFESGKLAR